MKAITSGILLMLLALVVLYIVSLSKWYSWERIDIINIATISTSVIAIVGLFINVRQYLLSKDKRLYELGEFRIEKIYKPKIERIERLKISFVINEQVLNKGRGFELGPNNIHFIQHDLIEYLTKHYNNNVGTILIYSPENSERNDDIFIEFLNVLKGFHDGISNFSPWIMRYHRQYLSMIEEIRKDKNISKDQKESLISNILLNDMLGYNMIMRGKKNNNFTLVSSITYSPKLKINTIGYLDLIKSMLPTEAIYLKALGDYKNLFERDLPK